ncbi:hypothetical protein AO053_02285 [Haemophilus influenzae biotype aegyptius]|uniref:hypothetical protein n=1 Tax=Haemophilus influenzae TaxID=727 RepID=UPI000318AFD8|nr:hypothetical protein [Haemophilus influenzae]QEQ61704.1 DUF4177 domain-containing protein [Haemophilus influenzae biotype aegyptius]QEQ64488.1 DUF4177 domain-containing protein [Haemophilus influenzae biotype aegyptius]QEQ65474.1 DUF4177 domain-containing protein [Haemophilus influenzae biotype aegyptius]TMQ37255.1 hypothetical protein AO051_07015 [Haemophilus influenzae biotype aegyptius]TMQ38304.1 hypothetical protein AO052_06595 [Haemophilus influenzae biotype aegyptius]
MAYTYKMIQIPPNIEVDKKHKDTGAATYLERTVNEYAAFGWEFIRVDEIGVQEKPGCLGALSGQKSFPVNYYVITFRKPV